MKGKQLNISSQEQIRESEKTDNLMDTIALFMKLDQELTESEFEAIPDTKINRVKSKRKLPPAQVFEKGYQSKLMSNPDCSKRTFAKSEKYRILGILEEIYDKGNKAYYADHETRELADEYIDYLDGIIEGKIVEIQFKPEFNSLDDLFVNPSEIEKCISVLKMVEPPIINEQGQYVGKLKSALVVWIEVLHYNKKLKNFKNKCLPELLMKKFPGLSISSSLFKQHNPKADLLRKEFKFLLAQKL